MYASHRADIRLPCIDKTCRFARTKVADDQFISWFGNGIIHIFRVFVPQSKWLRFISILVVAGRNFIIYHVYRVGWRWFIIRSLFRGISAHKGLNSFSIFLAFEKYN